MFIDINIFRESSRLISGQLKIWDRDWQILKLFQSHVKNCILNTSTHCYSPFFPCLISIKYQPFVYCVESLPRKGKFSAILADIWILSFSTWIIQREPWTFRPLTARHRGSHLSNLSSSSAWLFDLLFIGQ